MIGVQRMPHFVRDGEHVVRGLLIVQQYIRMQPENSRAVRAAALTGRFADIDPAFGKTPFQKGAIIFSERGKTFDDKIASLFVRKFKLGIGDQRRINVVHMLLVQLQDLFAQSNIAVHRRKVFGGRLR